MILKLIELGKSDKDTDIICSPFFKMSVKPGQLKLTRRCFKTFVQFRGPL